MKSDLLLLDSAQTVNAFFSQVIFALQQSQGCATHALRVCFLFAFGIMTIDPQNKRVGYFNNWLNCAAVSHVVRCIRSRQVSSSRLN